MKAISSLLATALFAVPAFATDVGVSVAIGDPGFYGRIDIGSAPQPRILYRDPVVITHVVRPQPVYMRVPPGHARNWSKHCSEYNACGERVYFVHDDWYNDVYAPYYHKQHGNSGHGSPGNSDHGNSSPGNSGKSHGNKH